MLHSVHQLVFNSVCLPFGAGQVVYSDFFFRAFVCCAFHILILSVVNIEILLSAALRRTS